MADLWNSRSTIERVGLSTDQMPTEMMRNVEASAMDLIEAPAVSILVVSFNTRDMTIAAIRTAMATTTASHEIIVVENASSDGSAEAIAAAFPGINLIALRENIGFGRANNLAAVQARGAHLLLLNPDTEVLDGAIDRLLNFAKAEPQAKIWGGRTVFGDGKLNPSSCWRRMTLWSLFCATSGLTKMFKRSRIFNPEAYPGWSRDSISQVDIVTGCFLLIRRTFWDELGGFDPAYFVYGEEADLCLRAQALGAKPMITPDAVIVHHEGQSTPAKANHAVRLLAGKIRLAGTHLPSWERGLAKTLLRSGPVVRRGLYGVAARFLPSISGKAKMWREVMERRNEWWRGYQ